MKIILQNLTKKFPSRSKKSREDVIAVNDFNFEIPDGKLVGLLGPSGCGKSTTLNLICGLQKPTAGKIFFGDDDVTNLPPENRGVGLVFQNYALYPHLTVQKNIMFPLENLKGKDKLTKEEMQKRALDAARLVQIQELMDRRPGELSGGQQQRVAIARALVKMPRVLLLDEPLSNLDARLRLQTREEIKRIQKETGITTIFVTHDQDEAMSISDLIVVMKEGVVQQIGRPQEVYDNPVNLFVAKFLGTPPINVFRGTLRDGKLFIGDDACLDVLCAAPQKTLEAGTRRGTPGSDSAARGSSEPDTAACDASGPDTAARGSSGQTTAARHAFGPDTATPGSSGQTTATRDVLVGIRPEGFILQEDGPLHCRLDRLEVMGRDVSVVSTHECSENMSIRSIIAAESSVDPDSKVVRFGLKPSKVFIFDKDTGNRIS